MTTQAEAFLVLEKSLSTRMSRQWQAQASRIHTQIIAAVDERQFDKAHALVSQYAEAMTEVAQRNQRYIEFIGMQATIFGASRLTQGHASRTMFAGDDATQPEEVTDASAGLVEMLGENGGEDVMRSAHTLIDREQADQEDEAYKSDEALRRKSTSGFIRRFQSSVNSNGEAFINIGSSLHTSRLGAWGFTQEADFRGIKEYQVSEQLDSRTCPVCRAMHGRKFTVGPAATKLEGWLGVKDLNQLKSIAPWPKQDRKSVQLLRQMPNDQIRANGWDTPPYHPLCRGILVEVGAVPLKLPEPVKPIPETIEPRLPVAGEVTEEQFEEGLAFMGVGNSREAVANHVKGLDSKVFANFSDARGSKDFNDRVAKVLNDIDPDTVLSGMDDYKKAAVYAYTNTRFRRVNKHLRGVETHRGAQVYSDWADEGLSGLPTANGKVYRGMSILDEDLDAVVEFYQAGKIVTEKAFVSTAYTPTVSKAFGGRKRGRRVPFNFVIDAKGKRGHTVIPYSEFPDELEVVFRKNTSFRVLQVDFDDVDGYTIFLEEVV